MKKILIIIGYCGAAYLFGGLIYLALRGFDISSAEYWHQAWIPLIISLLGFGAFFLKKPYRMLTVLFIVWLIGFFISLSCFPPGFSFFNPFSWGYAFDTAQNRHDFFRALLYWSWCLFGMGQVFIKQPPRDKIIIIHSFLTIFVAELWRIPLHWLKM